MPIHIQSRRKKRETTERDFPNTSIIDVTSRGPEPWTKFSPFYPHADIPVPFSPGVTAQSVEVIWQGLKVFESTGVDPSKFHVTNMKGIKRTVRSNGRVLGHAKGVNSSELLDYRTARYEIYLPAYHWVLEHKVADLVDLLRRFATDGEVVLLDYEMNCYPDDLSKPLSHAGVVKRWVEG